MSRVSNCLKMLVLLKARGFLSREELAKELDCNIRNIGEYKKELENIGYDIISTTGKYGGYSLNNNHLFPIVSLSQQQIKALMEAHEYVLSQNLVHKKEYKQAMDQVLANLINKEKRKENIYIHNQNISITKEIERMIQTCMQAIQDYKTMRITYKGNQDDEFKKLMIQPYEIVHSNTSYYLLAYSLKVKAFRMYKFSEERMKDVQITTTSFTRDFDFKASDHIGLMSVVKNQTYDLELIIKDEMALWMKENPIGIDVSYESINDHMIKYCCKIEGKYNVIELLLKLKDQVEIIKPVELKQEMKELLEKMLKTYQ